MKNDKYNYNRGNSNLNYNEGFKVEQEKFDLYKPVLIKTLQAEQLELITRGILDLCTGTDAIAEIDGLIYGISLRFRNNDYNSFTLSHHINQPYSEVKKWLAPNNLNLKPVYYIQVNELPNNAIKLIRVNIEAFAIYLQHLINEDELHLYFNPHLLAYEFNLRDLPFNYKGVESSIIKDWKK